MPRASSPRILGFLFVAALVDSCLAASTITLSLWLKDIWKAGPQASGLVIGLPGVAYVATTILLGHAADRIGRRRSTVIGCAILIAGTWFIPTAGSLVVLGLLFCVQRIGAAMFWPALQGWLGSGAGPRELPRRTAAFTIGWGIGYGLGTYCSGLGYEYLGPETTFHLICGVAALALVTCLRLPVLPACEPAPEGEQPTRAADSSARLQAWVGIFAAYLGLGALRALFPQYGTAHLGLTTVGISGCLTLVSIVQTLTFYYLGVVRPELAEGRWLRPTQLAAAIGMFLVATPWLPLVILGMMVVGFHVGVVYAASYYRSVFGRSDTSRQGGIHEAVVNAGAMLGPILNGAAAERIAPNAGWPLAGLAVLAAMAVRARRVDAAE